MLVPGKPDLSLALSIFYANVVINISASILTLILIWYMHRYGTMKVNVYFKCVLLMTFYQLVYDCTLYPVIQGCDKVVGTCRAVALLGQYMGGLGAGIWSLLIIVVCWVTSELGRKPNKCEERTAFVLINFLVLAYGASGAYQGYHFYNPNHITHFMPFFNIEVYIYLRLALIGVSLLVICRLYYVLTLVSYANNRQRSPLYHLLRKIIYYPIVQCITRLGPTPYNLTYGSNFSSFPENAGTMQTVLCYMSVMLAPSAGLGAFFVFLHMQAGSKAQLKRMLRLDCSEDAAAAAAIQGKKNTHALRESERRISLGLPSYPSFKARSSDYQQRKSDSTGRADLATNDNDVEKVEGRDRDDDNANEREHWEAHAQTPPWANQWAAEPPSHLVDYTYDSRDSDNRESSIYNRGSTCEEDWNHLSGLDEEELVQLFLSDKVAFKERRSIVNTEGQSATDGVEMSHISP